MAKNKVDPDGPLPKWGEPEGVKDCQNKTPGQGKKMKDVKEAKYSVDIDGLPRFYLEADTESKVKIALRKLLKKASAIDSVDRVNDAQIRADLRKRSQTTDVERVDEMNFKQFKEQNLDVEQIDEMPTGAAIKGVVNKLLNKKNYEAAKKHMKKTGASAADAARIFKGVDARSLAAEGFRNTMTTHDGETFKSKVFNTKKDADDHHWKMTKAKDKRGKPVYKKIETTKESFELDEAKQKPYVSSDRDGKHVMTGSGKIAKTFKDMDSAIAYFNKNYDKLVKESVELDEASKGWKKIDSYLLGKPAEVHTNDSGYTFGKVNHGKHAGKFVMVNFDDEIMHVDKSAAAMKRHYQNNFTESKASLSFGKFVAEASLKVKIAALGKIEGQLKKIGTEEAEMAAFLINQADWPELKKFAKDVKDSKVAALIKQAQKHD